MVSGLVEWCNFSQESVVVSGICVSLVVGSEPDTL